MLRYDEYLKRWMRELEACERGLEDMRDYQVGELVPFLRENPKSAAYVGMGLGKTISILTLLNELFLDDEIQRVLIIAPVRVAVQTWPTEIKNWRHTNWLDYSLIRPDPTALEVTSAMKAARMAAKDDIEFSPNEAAGRAKTAAMHAQRIAATKSHAPIHIVNREFVSGLVEHFMGPKGSRSKKRVWPYDCIIVDESTSFADHNSERWKSLARVAQRTKRLHLLSGTPAPEGIQQLFAQIYLLDHGARFGNHITPFREKYMMQNVYTKKWGPQTGAVEAVTELISDIAMVMKEEDYLPLDQPIVIERPIMLEPKELQAYKHFEETMILELDDDVEIEAVNAGVLSGKLLQYASGAVYEAKFVDEKRVNVAHTIHDHKIEELKELVEENKGQPLLVAYWFQTSLTRLQKQFPKATTMDKEGKCVDAWNAGKIPMLFVHPQSAGHGLNMQLGPGHTLIYYDTPASLELYLQLNKRIARFGQKAIVRIIHLVTHGTLDKLAVPRLRNKESAQDVITNYLRELRRKLKERKRGP